MNRKKWILWGSCFLPIIIMLVSWWINDFYPFGPKSFLAIDFSQQFIDLYIAQKRAVLSGDFSQIFYSFSKSIGGNMVGSWAYYCFSPFNIFYILFPISRIVDAVFLTICLRYGVIGLSMAYFLVKRHKADQYHPLLTILLSTAYALNGYHVSYQMVPIFYDAMWLLPLILVGLEELLDGEKPYKYTLLLSLTIFIQFYMGYMICIFIVLYSIFYLIVKRGDIAWKDYWPVVVKRILTLAGFSILAVLLISIIFIPNVLNLIDSKASGQLGLRFEWALQINPLDILSKFYIGAFDNDSWPFGPNLPNIYLGSLGLLGAIYYFISSKISRRNKWAASGVLLVFFISIVHEFTSKLWHMGQNPAGFFYRFSWILVFFLVYLAFEALKEADIKQRESFVLLACIVLMHGIVISRDFSFLTDYQKLASFGLFVITILILSSTTSTNKIHWLLLFIITAGELGVNAAISQGRINHTDAYKFQNAIQVIDKAIDPIRPSRDEFYRISKSFTRSKNDPMMFDYPGLTHFSSSLEVSTREFLERLGNNGVDASTSYFGTPISDAMLGVKYFVQNQPVAQLEPEVSAKTYVFGNDATRHDIVRPENLVGETDRMKTYQIPYTLPIAFGATDAMMDVQLEDNQPIRNQEEIAKALFNMTSDVFTLMAPNEVELVNLNFREDENGQKVYSKIDPNLEGVIRWKFVPQTDASYYISVPRVLSAREGEYRIQVNGKGYEYRKKFVSDQLFNIADNVQGQEQTIEIIINKDDEIKLTNYWLARFERQAVESAIKEKQDQGFQVTQWGNNFVRGQINQGQASTWLYTSIPYEDGWRVKVDGKNVKTSKVFDALLAIELLPGHHVVEFYYQPKGFIIGVLMTVISLFILLGIAYYNKLNNIRRVKKAF